MQCGIFGFPRYVDFRALTVESKMIVVKTAVRLFMEHEFSPLVARKFCFINDFLEELQVAMREVGEY